MFVKFDTKNLKHFVYLRIIFRSVHSYSNHILGTYSQQFQKENQKKSKGNSGRMEKFKVIGKCKIWFELNFVALC